MKRETALKATFLLNRIEQLEMQIEELENHEAYTDDIKDYKEDPYPSYIHLPMYDEQDIDDLVAVVQVKLDKAKQELKEL